MHEGNETRSPAQVRVLLCGAAMAGNMGGPALYIAMVQSLKQLAPDARVTVLSKYPLDDRPACEEMGWRLAPFPTWMQLAFGVPFALACGFLGLLHIPRRWLARGALAEYVDNDLMIDMSGISFSDDRPVSGLVINCLWLAPAIATGIPWVKAAQAMGPFRKPWVRAVARLLLPRAAALIARGAVSEQFVRDLLPRASVHRLPDVAFALDPAPDAAVDEALTSAGVEPSEPYCVVGPSELLGRLMSGSAGPDAYARLMTRLVDELVRLSGHRVLLLPHARATTVTPRLDDLNVCERMLGMCRERGSVRVLRGSFPTTVLKGVIARSEAAVGSRFHFMVAALSSGVPAMAVAWSHKYAEMMRMVGQERFAVRHGDATEPALLELLAELWEQRETIRSEILRELPEVKRQAANNAAVALEALRGSNAGGTMRT